MTFPKTLVILGLLFIVFSGFLFSQRYSTRTIEFENLAVNTYADSNVTPVRIIIPTLGIDQGIYGARITNGKWESTKQGVSYLSSSAVPGDSGNSILYGHNFPSLLGNLPKIKPGDKIEVELSNGEKKVFLVEYTSVVTPDQTHILNETKDSRITLYTCTGFLDSKRFVATALLSK